MNAFEWLANLDRWGFGAVCCLLSILWQSSLLFGATAIIAWFLRERRPHIRYALWVTTLLLSPAMPFLTSAVSRVGTPQARVSVLPVYTEPAPSPDLRLVATIPSSSNDLRPQTLTLSSSMPTTAQPQIDQPRQESSVETSSTPSIWNSPWALVALVYLAGALAFLSWIGMGYFRIVRWLRDAIPILDSRVLAAFRAAPPIRKESIVSSPLILRSPHVRVPLSIGWLHPCVLLPENLIERLSDEDLATVVLHETAHLRRRDSLVLFLIGLVRAVLFFHPLVWIAARQASVLAEQCADKAVLDIDFYSRLGHARLSPSLNANALFENMDRDFAQRQGALPFVRSRSKRFAGRDIRLGNNRR